ncbi:MAG: hypothetical protein MJY79_01755 [Bacteroidaceae bacterium]|nr:hypothetical protein [Bacteroidaceae bacterium]
MKRIITTAAVFAMVICGASAQNPALTGALVGAMVGAANVNRYSQEVAPKVDYSTLWYYDQGPLTLDKFQARREVEDMKVKSELYWNIEKNPYKFRTGNTVFPAYNTKANMDMKRSWYTRGLNDEWMLRYNQMLFDMVEYNRRLLQNDLDAGETDASTLLGYYTSELVSTEENILYETNMGTDTTVIVALEKKYRKLLEETPATHNPAVPEFRKGNWGWGFFFLFGFERYSGDATDIVDYTFSPLGIRWDISYKKLVCDIEFSISAGRKPNLTLGYDRVIYDSQRNWNWTNDRKIQQESVDVKFGYNAFENERFMLVPNVGIGYSCFGQETDEQNRGGTYISSYLNGSRVQAGVSARYKIRKWINSFDYSDLELLFEGAFIRSNYEQLQPSNSFLFTMGIGGIDRMMK